MRIILLVALLLLSSCISVSLAQDVASFTDPLAGFIETLSTFALNSDSYSTTVGNSSMDIYILRLGGYKGAASVRLTSTDLSALAAYDYQAVDGRIQWADKDLTSRHIVIQLNPDYTGTTRRQFSISLTQPQNAYVGVPNSAIIYINDIQLNQSASNNTIIFSNTTNNLNNTNISTVSTTASSIPTIPIDSVECYSTVNAADYRGLANYTMTGQVCQSWSQSVFNDQNHPNAGLHNNYCRNPNSMQTVWCFTSNPSQPIESCSVPPPQLFCVRQNSDVNVTLADPNSGNTDLGKQIGLGVGISAGILLLLTLVCTYCSRKVQEEQKQQAQRRRLKQRAKHNNPVIFG
jgi:hypothetical protein